MEINGEIAVFQVDQIICGLDISYVQEINKHINITRVYGAPDYVRGIMNLRGQIVTVIDMRKKFGLESVEFNDGMRIVVTKYNEESIGLLVDGVKDVISAATENIEPPPSNVKGVSSRYFNGVLKLKDSLLMLLDKDKVLDFN
ncbi:MAG: purine-binding chemotaxis protein CheW [Candidatus Marinimicrobia bacterium]|nr:purine-binding chemotaxis protein CheW [Candidatus Neomarinimicrobiota bacterium]